MFKLKLKEMLIASVFATSLFFGQSTAISGISQKQLKTPILGANVSVEENQGPDCRAYADHQAYWSQKGFQKGFDGDPLRGVMLRNKCEAENLLLASQLNKA